MRIFKGLVEAIAPRIVTLGAGSKPLDISKIETFCGRRVYN
ncbi:MAG: hypothetical protein ACSI46_05010 [Gloeotrichia echinulata DVL01]